MLLEECILAVHMRTVKQPIPIHDILPKAFPNVGGVVILLVLNVVFVGGDVLLLLNAGIDLRWLVRKGLLLLVAAELVVQIHENIGAVDLYERLVSRLEEHSVFFVQVGEEPIAQN